MKVSIIGAGPIGCLAAIRFRSRGHDVNIYEQRPDWRYGSFAKGRSFNLTLSSRGLNNLDEGLRQDLYQIGVPMPHRVIHHSDGAVSQQPYGIRAEHHILSIPRLALCGLLLDHAEKAGAKISFEHECTTVDTHSADIRLFSSATGVYTERADLIVGCDGANSIVRHEISKRSPQIRIEQIPSSYSYIELNMPPKLGELFAETTNDRIKSGPQEDSQGLHIWPRNNSLLIAQPNIDKSFTTTLFMPHSSGDSSDSCLDDFTSADEVKSLMTEEFSDIIDYLPTFCEDILDCKFRPALKSIKISEYHHGKAVLLGDSAHAMVPFFGQGINCGFEDVSMLFQALDEQRWSQGSIVVEKIVADYSSKRVPNCESMTALSSMNLDTLAKKVDHTLYQHRQELERRLYRESSGGFIPLYCAIAFTKIPYKLALDNYRKSEATLDELCAVYDVISEKQIIIDLYLERAASNPACIPVPDGGLEISIEEATDLLSKTSTRLLKYFTDIEKKEIPVSYVYESNDVSLYQAGKEAAQTLREDQPPREGQPLDSLLDTIFDTAAANGTVHTHPGFMAHVPSGGLFESAVGEFISRSLNRFIGVWLATPGFVELEANVIRWFCEILGYDKHSFGYLTTGGSLANFMGILCAKERLHAEPVANLRLYISKESHYSVQKAAKMAGLKEGQIRSVSVDSNYMMDVGHLTQLLDSDKQQGLVPLGVVATAGTTNTGAIDDLGTISNLCNRENIWLHVDACFGGFFCLTQRGRSAMANIELADSIAVDAHKGLFLPHGNAALLVKNKIHLRATFEMPNSAYMPGFSQDPDFIDFCNYGPELSRETRALSAWLPIKSQGLDAFERCLDKRMDLANRLTEGLTLIENIEVLPRSSCLPVVTFRLQGQFGPDSDKLNQDLCENICQQKNVYLTTTTIPDIGLVNRICILHSSTSEHEINQCLTDVANAISPILLKAGLAAK